MTGPPRTRGKSRPWQQGDEEPVSFGTWLRRQREVRDISLREIADASKISLRYLEAFEQDRLDVLPAPVFARGFLREYAKYVGLDPDEVVNYFLSAQQALLPEEDDGEREPPRRRGGGWWKQLLLPIAVGAAIIAIAVAAFQAERGRSRVGMEGSLIPAPASRRAAEPPRLTIAGDAPRQGEARPGTAGELSPQAPPAPGVPASGAPPVEAPALAAPTAPAALSSSSSSLSVSLHFTATCWVEAVVDGRQRIAQEHAPGESLQLDARESVVLTVGNAGGVEVRVNGRPYALGRGSGQVARGVRIDLATARALAGGA